jgi:hypothetical protein
MAARKSFATSARLASRFALDAFFEAIVYLYFAWFRLSFRTIPYSFGPSGIINPGFLINLFFLNGL